MNPFPLIVAELRCNAQGCAAIVVLIAVAVALGIALSAQDRALTLASAGAAAGFQIVGQVDAALAGTHDLMRAVAFAFDGLVVTAVLLTIVAVLSGRRQSIGVLRALGAPPAFLFVTVWLHGVLLVGAGTLLGVGIGIRHGPGAERIRQCRARTCRRRHDRHVRMDLCRRRLWRGIAACRGAFTALAARSRGAPAAAGLTMRSAPAAIVLGCGEVGSAVALALFGVGYSVALLDEADPAWHRRGMAFTNAWYIGNAELEGVGACFCSSLKSIPSILARRLVAAATWSWPSAAGTLAPVVLIDARGRRRRGSEILRGRVPLTIGIGEGFAAGENVDIVVGLPADPAAFVVEAVRHGRFMTERRIGDAVRAGQIVAGLGNEVVLAPATGVLCGLAARGARIEPGDRLVEVDPAGVAHRCFGTGAGSRRVAASVVSFVVRERVPT